MLLHTIAGIAWDPQLRGFLAVGVGVVVLLGSTVLLLTTNLGSRLGFLLAASAFFGWCTIMGMTWWLYGNIGMIGEDPSWVVTEVVYSSGATDESGLLDADLELARVLDTAQMPAVDDLRELDPAALSAVKSEVEPSLSGWEILEESNTSFGEAKATVDEYFVENNNVELDLSSAADYVTVYAFERGGKIDLPANANRFDRIGRKLKTTFWQVRHPPRYALIQVRPVVEPEPVPGEAPPLPEADLTQPVVSVILKRDLGDRRFPGAMLTLFSGIMFGVTVSMLHRRDLRSAAARGVSLAIPEG
ncbi:MAG: hypothetical protein EXQ71_09605 [Acidimicrobiia bacterium]|nr:hypothetical protein [Acidimicrobiia bacterium]